MAYLNFADVFFHIWQRTEFLNNGVPASENEKENRVFVHGLNHVSDEQLCSLQTYAVLDSLGEGTFTRSKVLRYGVDPYRLRIYSCSMANSQRLREKIICEVLRFGYVSTDVGHICRIQYAGRRNYEAANSFCSQVTFQPEMAISRLPR